LGELAGRIANLWHLARYRKWRGLYLACRRYPRADLRATLHRYRQFPLLLLPSQTLDSGVGFAQSAALAYFFGPSGLGMFFLMRRTLDLPVAFVFRSLSDIFYARQARDVRFAPDRVRPFFMRSVLLLAGAGTLVGVPLMIASPTLFALIFGPEWRQAGVLAAIMAPAAIMNLAVAPVARVFALTTKPHLRFWFSAANLGGTLLALLSVKLLALDLVGATIALSIATFVAYVVYFVAGYVASAALLPPEPVAEQ
jgi:O-antigen/teichoic acid export membrane protein